MHLHPYTHIPIYIYVHNVICAELFNSNIPKKCKRNRERERESFHSLVPLPIAVQCCQQFATDSFHSKTAYSSNCLSTYFLKMCIKVTTFYVLFFSLLFSLNDMLGIHSDRSVFNCRRRGLFCRFPSPVSVTLLFSSTLPCGF